MKRILSVLIILVFVLSLPITSFADDSFNAEKAAELLNQLGLFSGTAKGYELDRGVSRVEGSVMIVRLLGKEDVVKANKFNHPFKDVPAWADNYIGYLYQNGITSGITATRFGANDKMDAVQYTTLILRSIGLNDNDFVWNQSLRMAESVGLLTKDQKDSLEAKGVFLRRDMVLISFDALQQSIKYEMDSLAEKLINEGAIDEETYKNVRASYYMCGDNKYSYALDNPFFQQKVVEYGWLEEGVISQFNEVLHDDENFDRGLLGQLNRKIRIARGKFFRTYTAYVSQFLEEGDKNLGTYRKINVKDKLKEEYGIDIFKVITDDLRIDIYNRALDTAYGKNDYQDYITVGEFMNGSLPILQNKSIFYDEVVKTLIDMKLLEH